MLTSLSRTKGSIPGFLKSKNHRADEHKHYRYSPMSSLYEAYSASVKNLRMIRGMISIAQIMMAK